MLSWIVDWLNRIWIPTFVIKRFRIIIKKISWLYGRYRIESNHRKKTSNGEIQCTIEWIIEWTKMILNEIVEAENAWHATKHIGRWSKTGVIIITAIITKTKYANIMNAKFRTEKFSKYCCNEMSNPSKDWLLFF